MIRLNQGVPDRGLIAQAVAARFVSMKDSGGKIYKWRKTVLLNLIIGTVLVLPVVALAEKPVWRATKTAFGNGGQGQQKDHLSFQCPRAFLGIKGDMLPTHWQAADRGSGLQLGYASIDGTYMICTYRSPKNRKQRFGPVRRLAPRGYRCISDGISSFRCQKK
ncbi:hypothetical protein MNBD_GAMMA24-2617 [hydrothermal vent metagenome]|uniref:Uncharacterized protein n=1 Tax=hydrothermal vent metagenome TaxID=652676 RepID=A0A3B1BT39_9ZZZZ